MLNQTRTPRCDFALRADEPHDVADSEAPDGSTVVRENKGKQLENVKMIDLPDGRGLYGAKVTATPGLYDIVLTISDPTP